MDDIGQRLRAARIEKGLTIDDLQQTTKIQKRYLIAIEEGQLDKLPGDFYVRAFMKKYAKAVGLDSRELLGDTIVEPPENSDSIVSGVSKQLIRDDKNSIYQGKKSVTFNSYKRYLPQVIVIALVVIILGAIFAIATQNKSKSQTVIPDKSSVVRKHKTNKRTVEKKEESKEDKKPKDKNIKVVQNQDDFEVSNLPSENNELTVSASGEKAWIQVMIDGDNTWAGSIEPNQNHVIDIPNGSKNIQVHSGNSRSTNMKINDTDIQVSDLATGKFVRTFNLNIK